MAALVLAAPLDDPIARRASIAEHAGWTQGATAIVAGWGVTAATAVARPQTLHEADVSIPAQGACARSDGHGLGSAFDAETMVCAGDIEGDMRDTCGGDSGGPLIARTPSGPMLIALTSAGIGCASGYYGIYARIDDIGTWIDHVAQHPLPAPRAVRLLGRSASDRVSINWAPVPRSTKYGVWLRSTAFDDVRSEPLERDRLVKIVIGSRAQIRVPPRRAGSTLVTIRAIEPDGTQGASANLLVQPRYDRVMPAAVSSVRVVTRNMGSLQLAWSPVRDPGSGIDHYTVERQIDARWSPMQRTRSTRIELDQVPRGTIMRLRVRARDRAGNAGPPSRRVSARAL